MEERAGERRKVLIRVYPWLFVVFTAEGPWLVRKIGQPL
jgi:hypothetical protein